MSANVRKFEKIISALLNHPTIKEAAESIGMEERQIYRILKDDEFQKAYKEARRAVIDQAISNVAGLLSKSIKVLVDVIDNPTADHSDKIRAASQIQKIIFDRVVDLWEFDERLKELERNTNEDAK